MPVISPDAVRTLPKGHVLVISRTAAPTVIRVERVWKRFDVRRAAKRPLTTTAPAQTRQASTPAGVDIDDLEAYVRGETGPGGEGR